ncbi:conserved hypothetical protein [Nitrosomonas mobilis]|uniref:Uncharacterized protein n=1 Tax=Nitrosomonas mobilis TaxID=51642 RepID=A0A1G5SIC1_9PROT|nr:conserved hypothetical protein [Nitrosomonas mobilis]
MSGGGARIVDKYRNAEIQKKLHQKWKQKIENKGSAVPLHVTGYSLKLDTLLS